MVKSSPTAGLDGDDRVIFGTPGPFCFVETKTVAPVGSPLTAGPLTDYTPLVRFGDGGVNTQYDMDWIERIGLLKMDFLGLRNLTVMENAVREIRRRH